MTTPSEPDEPPVMRKSTRTDVQQVIAECLQIVSKDGLAHKRVEDVENCFW
jgi:hypothetical protein